MKYLGVARALNGNFTMPDGFNEMGDNRDYEVVEIGGDILLLPSPARKEHWDRIVKLADISIAEHKETLEGLAK